MSRLLVTGCGRSGTGFAAQVLRHAGINCGHEDVFKLNGSRPYFARDWGKYGAESSWLAVPYLANRELYDTAVLLVRHPLAVIRSWMQLNLLSDEPVTDSVRREVLNAVYRFRPEVQREASQLDRCAAMWFYWNTAALPYVNTIVRHEALIRNAGVLLDSFGIESNVDVHQIGVVNDKSHEKRRQFATPDWEDIRPKLSREVRRLAQSLGYYD